MLPVETWSVQWTISISVKWRTARISLILLRAQHQTHPGLFPEREVGCKVRLSSLLLHIAMVLYVTVLLVHIVYTPSGALKTFALKKVPFSEIESTTLDLIKFFPVIVEKKHSIRMNLGYQRSSYTAHQTVLNIPYWITKPYQARTYDNQNLKV